MKIPRSLLAVAICFAFTLTLHAQVFQPTGGYHRVACIKVKPGQASEFSKFAAGDLHKFAQSRVDSGALTTWYLLRSVIPVGESAECDYLTVSMYPAAPTAPMTPDDTTNALHKAGLNISAEEYNARRDSMTTLISNNLFQNRAFVGVAKKGDYFLVNYMHTNGTEDWVAYEKKTWQPLAEEMLKEGSRSGWSLNVAVLPFGSDLKYDGVTVDVYSSWDSIFSGDPHFADRFHKVHPDMEIGTTFETYEKLRSLVKGELYHLDDAIVAAK